MSASIRRIELGHPSDAVVAELVGELSEPQRVESLSWMTTLERQRFESEVVGRGERFLSGRWLLRMLVAELLRCEPSDVLISSACLDCGGEHGAPLALAHGQKVWVSLSHAADAHIAAVSLTYRVGVDVELPREGIDVEEWARREAMAKVDGIGLREPARELGDLTVKGFTTSGLVGALAWVP